MSKETKVSSKDTRIALSQGDYEKGLANAVNVDDYKAMFRPKGMRNLQYLSDEQRVIYNNAREILATIGTIKGKDGKRLGAGTYIKVV